MFAENSASSSVGAILNALPDHIAVVNRQGIIRAVNDAWEDFAVRNGEPDLTRVSVGVNYLDVCRRAVQAGDQVAERALSGIASVLNGTDDHFAMDYECSSPAQQRWYSLRVVRQKTPAAGILVIHSDITHNKRNEEALRRSEGWLRLLTDSLPVLISYVDQNHRYRFNNRSYENWFGHSPGYVEGKHLQQVLGEEAYQVLRPRVEAALAGDLVTFEEFIPYHGAGRYVRATYVPDTQDGRVRGFFALIQDLTERKQIEEEICESRDKLSTIITGADVGTWDWNIPAGTSEVNDRFSTMLGYEPANYGNDVNLFFERLHPDDVENVHRLVATHFAGGSEFYRCDFRLRRADGSYKWIHGAGRLIERDHAGKPLRMVGIHVDIDERKLADELLRTTEEEFRTMFELAAVGNAQGDPETGCFTRVNRKFCEITGYTEQELLGMTYTDITHPDDRDRDAAEIQKVLAGKTTAWSIEKRYVRKDGQIIWATVNGTVIRRDGRLYRTVKNIVDITERKSLDATLNAHRHALRNLAMEISQTQEKERRQIADDLHDHIGQSLMLAKIKVSELKEALPAKHSVAIEQIRMLLDQSISETRVLIRDLSPQVLYQLGLEAAIDWLAEQTQAKYGLRCMAEVHPLQSPIKEARRIVLFQAARELLINVAKHARADKARIILQGNKTSVTICVEDNGTGFDSSLLTVPNSTATGFGLFSIRERLAALDGELQIDSAPGQGTKAIITLPAHAA